MATAKKAAAKKVPAKKAAAKKAVAKKGAKKVAAKPAAGADYSAAYGRWSKGESIAVLARELGLKRRSTLRRAFKKLAGGPKEFKALRAGGAGGAKAEPKGRSRGKAGRGEARAVRQLASDAAAVRVPHAERQGWETIYLNGSAGKYPVSVAPDGAQYINADSTEPAQFLFETKAGNIGARMIRLDAGVRR